MDPATVLQVQCGTCMQILSVPANLLDSLLQAKEYSCPKCQSRQAIHLRPEQEHALRNQARTLRAQQVLEAQRQAAQAARARPPMPPHRGMLPRPSLMPPWPQPGPSRPATGRGYSAHPLQHRIHHHRPPQQPQQAQHAPLPRNIGALFNGPALQQQQAQQQAPQQPPPLQEPPEEEEDLDEGEVRETFIEYTPAKLPYGKPHPDPVVETASLASVDPPNITYQLLTHDVLVDEERLSALQLESIVYACQRHEQRLPDGTRAAFFIGDGAGVGKGRTIAGLILENYRAGRKKHLWISVGSDLKFDARRDLDDAGATDIELHALNKLPYGKLESAKIGIKEGVIFLTYSSLISSSDRGRTRFKQLVEWCGSKFDGLIIFDESHKAKNLVPEAGSRSTQVGLRVKDIQEQLPEARIVYCSATGASEPRNMGYMVRLGLWGRGHSAFQDFSQFLDAVQGKGSTAASGMATLELVAMDMKAHGMYVSRTLSFSGAEFETIEAPLEEPVASQYAAASKMWSRLYREFLEAEEQLVAVMNELNETKLQNGGGDGRDDGDKATGAPSGVTGVSGKKEWRGGSAIWRYFWSAHQRFFRHMCMAAKVPAVVRMVNAALAQNKCVVIGLQSTGEARTADVIADKGEELDDFVSGPKELLLRLLEDHYPLPPDPADEDAEAATTSSDEEFADRGTRNVTEAVAKGRFEMREQSLRQLGRRQVRYKEYHSDEDIGITSSDDDDDDDDDDDESDGGSSNIQKSASDSAGASGEDTKKQRPDKNGAAINLLDDSDDGENANSGDQSSGVSSDPSYDPAKQRRAQQDDDSTSSSSSDREAADNALDESTLNAEELEMLKKRREKREKRRAHREAQRLRAEHRRQWREKATEALSNAIKKRDELRELVNALELPANPLDDLIDRLGGPNHVAEMTGRKGRLVRDPNNGNTVKYEPRNASGTGAGATLELINVHERNLFLDGTKLISIISEAASAGISLHADRRVKNQRRRVHLTLELPWSADKAIQQFGRSHRANQTHGPQYRLIFTPLGGERRFASAVARRLETLGALTQGDRRAGPSLAAFNYESTWGQKALRETYAAILGERKPVVLPLPCRPGPDDEPPLKPLKPYMGYLRAELVNFGLMRPNRMVATPMEMEKWLLEPEGAPVGCGSLEDRDRADVPRFLNRLLGLSPSAQGEIFDYFQSTMDALVDKARREGNLDEGILDLRAHSITMKDEPKVLHKDPTTGAATLLYTIKADRGLPWLDATSLLLKHLEEERQEAQGLLSPIGGAAAGGLLAAVPVGPPAAGGLQPNNAISNNGDGEDKVLEMVIDEIQGVKSEVAGDESREIDFKQHGQGDNGPTGTKPDSTTQPDNVVANGTIAHDVQAVKPENDAADDTEERATKRQRTETTDQPADQQEDGKEIKEEDEEEDLVDPYLDFPTDSETEEEEKVAEGSTGAATASDSSDDEDAIDLTVSDDDGDDEEKKKKAAKKVNKNRYESGFYRARSDTKKRISVLVALRVPGSSPPTFSVYRPATGRGKVLMPLKELKAKYVPLVPRECKKLWKKAFKTAGKSIDGRPAVRIKTVHVLGGAVMRSWGSLQRSLSKLKTAERRVKVLRIATTGEDPQRLVGMLVPESVVDQVVNAIIGEGAVEKGKEAAKTDGAVTEGGQQ